MDCIWNKFIILLTLRVLFHCDRGLNFPVSMQPCQQGMCCILCHGGLLNICWAALLGLDPELFHWFQWCFVLICFGYSFLSFHNLQLLEIPIWRHDLNVHCFTHHARLMAVQLHNIHKFQQFLLFLEWFYWIVWYSIYLCTWGSNIIRSRIGQALAEGISPPGDSSG